MRRIRAVHTASPFAFEVVTTSRWRFGPWPAKATRDGLMKEYQRSHPGRPLRPWAIEQGPGAGGLTTGDTQT